MSSALEGIKETIFLVIVNEFGENYMPKRIFYMILIQMPLVVIVRRYVKIQNQTSR